MEPVRTIVAIVAGYAVLRVIKWILQWYKSPFAYNSSKPRLPYVIDQASRARVLKQQFSIEKVLHSPPLFCRDLFKNKEMGKCSLRVHFVTAL